MSEFIKEVARTLKAAREAKGLSQRGLAARADLPQSHISKIENGGVDLRVSSLVELARALDLELALVPRISVPAVKSIVRKTSTVRTDAAQSANKSLARLQKTLNQARAEQPQHKEIAQIQRYVRELQQFKPRFDKSTLDQINSFARAVEQHKAQADDFRKTLDLIASLRNSVVHDIPQVERPRPAYSLEEDNDG